jgi:hypothetical protein
MAIDPASPDEVAGAVVVAVMHDVGGKGRAGLCIPGPHPAIPELLAAGYRIFERDTFCATDPRLIDPARIVPDPSFL